MCKNSSIIQREVARFRDSLNSEGHLMYAQYDTGKSVMLFFRHPNGSKTQVEVTETTVTIVRNNRLVHQETVKIS